MPTAPIPGATTVFRSTPAGRLLERFERAVPRNRSGHGNFLSAETDEVRCCEFVQGTTFGDMNWLGALNCEAVVGDLVTA